MATIEYYHRYNDDGSCETVCTRCFVTLGRADGPTQLKLIEAAHHCTAQPNNLDSQCPDGKRQMRESVKSPMQAWILKSIRASIKASRQPPTDHRIHVRRLWYFLGRMDAADTFLLLCSILLCSYLLPTIMEMEMIKHMGVWAGCILFGDAAGCSFLSLGLGLRKTGGWLYALLTVCEGSLYAAHIVPVHLLVWLVDIGPTLAIMGLIAFCFFHSRLDRIINTV